MRFLMLLAICFVVGMLVLGDNPLREFQKKQEELRKTYGTDELTITTNLYLEQQRNSGYGGMFGGAGAPEPTNETSMINSIKSSGNVDLSQRDPASDTIVKVARPDDDLSEDNFVGVEVKNNASVDADPAKTTKISNYYPPIVGQAESLQPQQKPVVFTGREPRLRSGQVIAFEGTFVYLVDDYGNKKPMPDGTYNLQDGNTIVVINGRSMLK